MDDQAIGGGAGASMSKTAAESADHSGPLEERCVSKNWSVRSQAFDDLGKLCVNASVNSKEPFFIDHADKWKLYLKDTNPGALDKALTTLIDFLKKIKGQQIVDNQNGIITVMCEKMLFTHAKPNIKAKSLESFLLLFEASENFDDSVETLQGLLAHKNVKVLANAVIGLGALVNNYGMKRVKVAEYAELMLKNASSTNPEVKKQSYNYYKAVYKWVGDAILPQIEDKLKKTQMDDLKKLFDEQKASGDKSKRFTRKEAIKEKERLEEEAIAAAIAAENGEAPPGEGGEGGEAPVEAPVDPLEFAPVKDILADFGPEFFEATAAIKKWNEKVDELNKIIAAASNVKIKNGNFGPMADFLNKEIRATNVNTAMGAINVVAALAKGMKKDFGPYVKVVIEAILIKYKEKRPVVQEACNNATEALVACCNLEEIIEQIGPCITHVAPGVKLGSLKFVEKHVFITYIDILQRVSDQLLPLVAKTVDDKDGSVRDVAIHCFGLLKGRLGEDFMAKFIKDLNPQKTEKLNEAAQEIKPSKYDRPENWKPPVKKKKKVEEDKDEDEDTPKKPVKKKKAVKKKAAAPAEEEASEKKPAAEAAPKKKPAAAGSTKGPTAPVIADDNVGGGIDPEQACEMVAQAFNPETVASFDAAKWQEKVAGFEGIQNEIRENQPESETLEAVAKFIKVKMKDFKESNINLQKGTIATFNVMASESQAMSKRCIAVGAPFFVDKIGDVKLSKLIFEMMLNAAEVCSPNFIALQVIKYAATAKAPNTIKEGCNFITQMIDEFGPQIPLKETIDFAKVAAAHSTPAVRQGGMKLFKELYKHAGDVIRNFMSDIKEATLKLIDGELKTIQQFGRGEHQPTRELRGAAAAAAEAAGGGKKGKGGGGGGAPSLLDSLPRQDISKKLSPKLLEQYNNKGWQVRKKCGDDVEAILREAQMRIEPNGLNELMDVMKKAMKDANKAVVKVFIILLGLLADAVGLPIGKYQKKCFVPMLSNLSDKQALVREEVIKCMNKWSDAIGAEKIINHLAEIIAVENPEARGEGLKWILLHEASIAGCDNKSLVSPLVACLTDKSKAIRELAEQVSVHVMVITGHPTFLNACKDRPPAVQQTLKPVLERIKSECAGAQAASAPEPEPAAKTVKKGAPAKASAEEEPMEDEAPQMNSFARPKTGKKQPGEAPDLGKKKAPAEDELSITPQNKKKREQFDTRSKYPLNEVKGDHVERLQNQCADIFGLKFSDLMFAKNTDFQKHIKCVEQIETCIENQPGELMEVLDIVFKWANLRMCDSSNTKLAGAFFDFYQKLLSFLIAQEYQMLEFEIVVLLGTLCDKTGHNIKIMAEKGRQLAEMCYRVYEPKLCFKLIMQHGVQSKNLKAVAECLDMLAEYVRQNGVDSITKKDFAIFLEKANSGDKNVRENTLRVFAETYKVLREDIWRLLGKDINGKVKGLLEQRFKQIQNNPDVSMGRSNNASGLGGSRGPAKPVGLGSSSGPGGPGGLMSSNKKPANVEEITNQMQKQDLNSSQNAQQPSGRRFQSRSRSPSRGMAQTASGPPPEQNAQMQDVFSGKVPVPGQQDVDMADIGAEDNAAQEMPSRKPFVNLDDALNAAEMQMDTDPELRKHMEAIQRHIDQLKVGDLLKRVDSLVALNEVISATGQNPEGGDEGSATKVQQRALIRLCDKLINAFSQVMVDIFSFPVKEIPLRFTKYFITIVNKTCSSKEIMKEVSCEEVRNLVDQLLQRLLIDNLDKIGSNKEGELILKNLNSSMLRMLENCNHTYIFVVLFGLLTKYKDSADQPKIPSLIIKCLLKLSKNMDKLIEKVDLKKFMVAIHEYLVTIPLDKKTQNDDLGTRIAKTLINEIVKLKRNDIWEYYQVIEQHPEQDNHLQKWIQIILKSLSQNIETSSSLINNVNDINVSGRQDQPQSNQGRMYTEFEMKKIVQDLKEGVRYTNAIQRLDKFIKSNPNYDWKKTLVKEGLQFTQKVSADLEKFRKGALEMSHNNNMSGISGNNTTSSIENKPGQMSLQDRMQLAREKQNELNNSMNKQDAFKNKMNRLTNQRSSVIQQPVQGLNSNTQAQQNLNTSFSEMNRNLSNKWAQINQSNRGGLTGREQLSGQNNLANTMRHTTASTPGTGNLLNTSSGGFKNRLQNKFANKQNPNNSSLGGQMESGAETGTIGQKISPQKMGRMGTNEGMVQQQNSQSTLNRSSNAGGISNKSFRDRLKGIKAGGQQANPVGGLASTQGPSQVGSLGGGGAATNQDLQKRLADMKAKLHGLRNKE